MCECAETSAGDDSLFQGPGVLPDVLKVTFGARNRDRVRCRYRLGACLNPESPGAVMIPGADTDSNPDSDREIDDASSSTTMRLWAFP